MKLTVREALDFLSRSNGMPYTEELENDVRNFLNALPHHPDEYTDSEQYGLTKTICDYEQEWYAVVVVQKVDELLIVEVVDGDNLDSNPHRVKSNEEAVSLLKQYENIRYAKEFDEFWHMSDDHRYWRKMSELDERARFEAEQIKVKLK